MILNDALRDLTRIFLDSAPVIYFIDGPAYYQPLLREVFRRIDEGATDAVTSPITLSECLIHPYRDANARKVEAFVFRITRARNTRFVPIHQGISRKAAQLRTKYNLPLLDAFQVATALRSECDGFLTNDMIFKRVEELKILVVDELEPDESDENSNLTRN